MNLTELADQYQSTADHLMQRLGDLKEQHKTARAQEAFLLEKRIDLLKIELYDIRKVMAYLRDYYC